MLNIFGMVMDKIGKLRMMFTDDEVFYIGGSEVLPPPLEKEQENRHCKRKNVFGKRI